jgi:hypothetical protein
LRTMSSAECRFRPAIRFIVPSRPTSGHRTLKLVGFNQREHATPMTSLSVSVAPAPPRTSFVMPDLTGMYWTDADPSLRALGWTGALVKGPDLPNSSRPNAIAVQSPAPGQLVGVGVTITVQFAS